MSQSARPSSDQRKGPHPSLLLVPVAALLAISPLVTRGCSCGHDLVFHMQSWLDAGQQFRQGILYPRWAFSPAWSAGEPRFIFYPPLSWMLGALLTLVFPAGAAPVLYIWIALTAAGVSMYYVIRQLARQRDGGRLPPLLAVLVSALYLANPYMLFNAFERSALAELLAAAWIPLLLLAALRPHPSIRSVAFPIALLWLTNAPAAVMGCYMLALLATLRLIAALARYQGSYTQGSQPQVAFPPRKSHLARFLRGHGDPGTALAARRREARSFAATFLAGAALGLALPAAYLLPAAFERRYVQVAMAVIPNLRFQDNFLFGRTDYEPHNVVTHTVSVLAVWVLLLTVVVLSALLYARTPAREQAHGSGVESAIALAVPLALLTLCVSFLLVPASTLLWQHLPELAFLQFPWRLLTILSAVLALALAQLLAQLLAQPTIAPPLARCKEAETISSSWAGLARRPVIHLATLLFAPLALSWLCFHLYGQACAPDDRPAVVAALFHSHHGAAPTDEYTPTNADNDVLRTDNPGYWLSDSPQASAPGTVPNPNATNPDYDRPVPIDQTVSAPAPRHLMLSLARPEDLIVNLRDYPGWRLSDNGRELAHIQRDDGLLAVALPSGPSVVDIAWRQTPDQELGLGLSGCALGALALTFVRRRA